MFQCGRFAFSYRLVPGVVLFVALAIRPIKYYNKSYKDMFYDFASQKGEREVMFMVSTSLMVSFMVSLCLTFLAPIVLMIVLGVRKKITPAPLAHGASDLFCFPGNPADAAAQYSFRDPVMAVFFPELPPVCAGHIFQCRPV